MIKEFCAENMEHVAQAVAAGAQRIELCDNLAVGGTTPSYGVIRAAVAFAREQGVEVMCMVRPRGGNFAYTNDEAAMMRDDLLCAKNLGVHGVVFGCLHNPSIDQELTRELIRLAHEPTDTAPQGIAVTFHMGLIGQKVCCQSSQNGYGSLWCSSSHTARSPHSGPPSSLLGDSE